MLMNKNSYLTHLNCCLFNSNLKEDLITTLIWVIFLIILKFTPLMWIL